VRQRAAGLNVVTLTPGCGYGDAGSEYIAGLSALGVPVTWTPTIANSAEVLNLEKSRRYLHESIRQDLLALWRRPLDCSAILVDIPPAHWHRYWRQAEPDLRPFTYIAWEVERLPDAWPAALNLYERVFVPSSFNQRALVAGGVTAAVDVVPHIAREVTPVFDGSSWGAIDDDDFVFYTIGAWTTRKAMEETIRAYLDAFSADERVALIVKTEPVNQVAYRGLPERQRRTASAHVAMVWFTLAQIMADYARPPKVHLVAKEISAREIDRLHTRGDCFISLTRSEGWGLGPFDAALFGNPVIITGWGGHLDYLGASYPFLVRYDLEATARSAPDGYHLNAEDVHWARADRRHASELMRLVFENRDWARSVARAPQPHLRASYASGRVCLHLARLMGFDVKR
jgi:glycosyltransferase involved in cell wall biosynthesis